MDFVVGISESISLFLEEFLVLGDWVKEEIFIHLFIDIFLG